MMSEDEMEKLLNELSAWTPATLSSVDDHCRCNPANPHYTGYDWENSREVIICATCSRYRNTSTPKTIGGCECGSEKTYGPNGKHSHWCPKWTR